MCLILWFCQTLYQWQDRCAVAVVENQDHVDAIESDKLPCGFWQQAFLRSAQMLEVFLDRHLSCPTWRPAKEIYGIIIFANFRRFNFRHAVAV